MLFSHTRASGIDRFFWLSDPIFANWITEQLRHYGSSICDVGAGNGSMAQSYKNKFSPIHLVEPSLPMFNLIQQRAKKLRFPIHLHHCPAEKIPLKSNAVDLAFSKSSLHHFADAVAGIKEMRRIARKAIAFTEVISPDDCCLEYLQNLVLQKEPSRNSDTIFTEKIITGLVRPYVRHLRALHFDQYIDLETWLEFSDLDEKKKKDLLCLAESQKKSVKEAMQLHKRAGRLVQLRRMILIIGVL